MEALGGLGLIQIGPVDGLDDQAIGTAAFEGGGLGHTGQARAVRDR